MSELSFNSSLEATWIDLSLHSQRLLIGLIYRPPDCSSFFDEFSVVMENSWRKRSNIILLGDFNVNLSSSCDPSLKRKFTNLLCTEFNLKNVIDVPTRITGDSSSLIDLIITSVPSKISAHVACNPRISDHHLVYASVNLNGFPRNLNLKLVRDFKIVDIKALQHEFASALWFICDIFDDCVWVWEALYKFIIDEHVLLRMAKVRSNSLPWGSSSLRKELNKRYNLLLKAQKTPYRLTKLNTTVNL